MNDTTNQTMVADAADLEKNKIMGVLAYLGILCIIPILVAKDSPFAMYHANQGLWLFIIMVAISVLSMIPLLGCILMLGFIPAFVFMIIGIMNAVNGKMVPLPGFDKLPVLVK